MREFVKGLLGKKMINEKSPTFWWFNLRWFFWHVILQFCKILHSYQQLGTILWNNIRNLFVCEVCKEKSFLRYPRVLHCGWYLWQPGIRLLLLAVHKNIHFQNLWSISFPVIYSLLWFGLKLWLLHAIQKVRFFQVKPHLNATCTSKLDLQSIQVLKEAFCHYLDTMIVANFNLLSLAIQGDTQRFEPIERFIKVRNLLWCAF